MFTISIESSTNVSWPWSAFFQGAFYQLCEFITGEMVLMGGSNLAPGLDIAPTVSKDSRPCCGTLVHCGYMCQSKFCHLCHLASLFSLCHHTLRRCTLPIHPPYMLAQYWCIAWKNCRKLAKWAIIYSIGCTKANRKLIKHCYAT